jgi:hypothetical protein
MLGGIYADLKVAAKVNGLSIWLHACMIALPDVLQKLLDAGCSVAETYVEDSARAYGECYTSGWNCLFFLVLHAYRPEFSEESESLYTLLSAGADPFLRDAKGYTVSEYVDDAVNVKQTRCLDGYNEFKFGCYQREL